MQHSWTVDTTTTDPAGVLVLKGDLTMVQAMENHRILLEAIQEVTTLAIELQNIGAMDMSFVQLLCSVHRECLLSGKKIHLQYEDREAINRLLEKSGYCKQLGCLPGAKESCLWSD